MRSQLLKKILLVPAAMTQSPMTDDQAKSITFPPKGQKQITRQKSCVYIKKKTNPVGGAAGGVTSHYNLYKSTTELQCQRSHNFTGDS